MSYTSTPEQDAVINWQGSQLVVNAFADTGKTSTLVRFAEANPECKILYLAYNRAVRDEEEQKFPSNVKCKTSHQLAWPQFGRHFRHRLTANLRITDVARKINTRYWPLTRLSEDFFDITDPLLPDEERQDEINLLYVADTRVRRTLVLNELLCWLKDNDGQNVPQN